MLLLVSVVEGWGLKTCGKWQVKFQVLKEFPLPKVVLYESIQAAMLLGMVLVCAFVVLKASQTFDQRRTYLQAFTVMAYGFAPLFWVRLADAGPAVSPWVTWVAGILMTIWVLYQGIPRVMQTDPTHAFGLYLTAVFVAFLTSGLVRVLTGLYLVGLVDLNRSAGAHWLAHKFPSLFQ